ncbi:hypothetical protein ADK75_03905 [Streptomyces virginiae]|uniref:HTH luxR-type domain-containing protein n=1 Tax=Streptomyces virginiae TaxID=1961 RepID=A0A0L8N491_STRVG|nr:AAA family ATPase [Streptomyces virginiae]KOG57497.1 hypothetical protein ADK75_03905 [Streptomyces virginiae]
MGPLSPAQPPAFGPYFVGRAEELKILTQRIEEAADGEPQAVWIEGDGGIGKTALVRQCLAGHPSLQVMWASCDPSETDYPYGVIDQLLSRVSVPPERSLLLGRGPVAPSAAPHQIGGELLSLLGSFQETGPRAIVVDDVQWADEVSMKALAFFLRRLGADRVITIFIARGDASASAASSQRAVMTRQRATVIRLAGLSEKEVAQLVASVRTAHDNNSLARRLRRYTGGHPLYVQTILKDLATHNGAATDLPLPTSLAGRLRQQIAAVPPASRALLEGLAILAGRFPLAVTAQVAHIDNPAEALEPLLGAGLVRWWPTEPAAPIEIHHPLQRDAVVESMAPQRKRQLHAAAALVVDTAAAWRHKVAATQRVDAVLADSLEQEAYAQLSQDNTERAATYLMWAAGLSPERKDSERRLLTAFAHLMWSEKYASVEQMLSQIQACAPSPLRSLVLGSVATVQGHLATAQHELTAVQQDTESLNQPWIVAMAAVWQCTGHMIAGDSQASINAARQAIAVQSAPRYTRRAIGFSAYSQGLQKGARSGLRELASLVDLPAERSALQPEDALLLMERGNLLHFAGELHQSIQDLTTALRIARTHGVPIFDEQTHAFLARAQYLAGEWDDAAISADTAMTLVASEDKAWFHAQASATACLIAASRGEWQRAKHLLDEIQTDRYGVASQTFPAIACATLAQAEENYEAVIAALEPITRSSSTSGRLLFQIHWLPLHTEALIGANHLQAADTALAQLRDLHHDIPALGTTAAWLGGWLAEKKGDLVTAQALYEQGIISPITQDDMPLRRGLLEHTYSRFLVSQRRNRRTAAEHLRNAYQRFSKLGATPFMERCAQDLAACGLQAPKGAPKELLTLTEREQGVAHLIAKGMTNQEAADELYLSSKTIEYHLSHIYAKLGVSSRRDLRALLQTT